MPAILYNNDKANALSLLLSRDGFKDNDMPLRNKIICGVFVALGILSVLVFVVYKSRRRMVNKVKYKKLKEDLLLKEFQNKVRSQSEQSGYATRAGNGSSSRMIINPSNISIISDAPSYNSLNADSKKDPELLQHMNHLNMIKNSLNHLPAYKP